MHHYEGCNCPICKKPFAAGDDIVVCPDCGAPYHRACYELQGACVFEEMHGPHFEWKRPASAPVLKKCPNCGSPYADDQTFCEHCGTSLRETSAPHPEPKTFLPEGFERLSSLYAGLEETDQSGEIDGIPIKDWETFIGPSAPYYIYQFKRMDATGKKTGLVFSAALFPYCYFFYRKMWLQGLLALLLELVLNLPNFLTMFINPSPLLASLNINVFAFLDIAFISSPTFSTIAFISSWLLWIVKVVVWGLFGAWFYRRTCAKRIRKLQQTAASEGTYRTLLRKKGGYSYAVLIVFVLIFLFDTMALTLMGGVL